MPPMVRRPSPPSFSSSSARPSQQTSRRWWRPRGACSCAAVDSKNQHAVAWEICLTPVQVEKIAFGFWACQMVWSCNQQDRRQQRVKSINDSRSARLPMTYRSGPRRCNLSQIGGGK
jgi:hypothetical protein